MRIGLLGMEFGSGNKGCEALGYGFLNILETIAKKRNEKIDVVVFFHYSAEDILKRGGYEKLNLSTHWLRGFGSYEKLKNRIVQFKKCDVVFDFTSGDSFSDIYGMDRFLRRTLNKQFVLWSKTPLILGSQTYGPFQSWITKVWAGHVIRRSKVVFTRDVFSKKYVKKLYGCDAIETVDVAFALQYKKMELENTDKIRVGFNPSGLLWSGGYSRDNQFGMTVDYQKYCRVVIDYLLKDGRYEVHLISHVLNEDQNYPDNDIVACSKIHKEFPNTVVAPWFHTPMEAKSYISGMDLFIGARMHATIAAYTTGVATIPFSYSRKFEGLFESLNYPYVISGCVENTEVAIVKTVQYIANMDVLKERLHISSAKSEKKLNILIEVINKLL